MGQTEAEGRQSPDRAERSNSTTKAVTGRKSARWWERRRPTPLSLLAILVLAGVWGNAAVQVYVLGKSQPTTSPMLIGAFAGIVLLGIVIWFVGRRRDWWRADEPKIRTVSSGYLLLTVTWLAAILAWTHLHDLPSNGIPLPESVAKGTAIEVTGQVSSHWIVMADDDASDPWNAIPKGDKQTIVLKNCHADVNGETRSVAGRVVAYLEDRKKRSKGQPPDLAKIGVGDQLTLSGKFNWPAAVHNPGQFDVRRWLVDSGISGQVNVKNAGDIVVQNETFRWSSLGDRLKNHFRSVVVRSISDDQQDMAAAILLGDRSLLEQEQKQRYAATGTIHILAISGLHVGILAGAFYLIGSILFVPRRVVLIGVISLVIFYAWLVEFRAPIVRAAVLSTVFCVAGLVRRRIFSLNSLAAAILVVFALQPQQLLNPGTHLSFLAVGSIVLLHGYRSKDQDPLEALKASRQPKVFVTARAFLDSVYGAYRYSAAVFFVCLPMVIHHFHVAAWIGLLINPLVILPMAVALVCGFLMLLTDGWMGPASNILGWGCSYSLSSIDWLVTRSHEIPGSHQYLASTGITWLLVWYGILFATLWYFGKSIRLRWLMLSLLVLQVLFRSFAIPHYPDRLNNDGLTDQLTATFIDVGHGNCTVLRTPDGQIIVCDAGSFPNSNSAVQKISSVLWAHGIERIDQLLISHADLDHYNAVPALLDRFRVAKVLYPKGMFQSEGESIRALQDVITHSGVTTQQVSAGDSLWQGSDCEIQVLGPPPYPDWSDDNAKSMVVSVIYGGKKLLLTGDLEKEGIEFILANEPAGVDILQVPHHGSRKNAPELVSQWAMSDYAIISALDKRVQQDVVDIYRETGATVLIPNREGATLFNVFSDGKVRMRQWDQDRWWIR